MASRTNRALRAYAWDDFRLVEEPIPAPGPGELLCRLLVCGVCSGEGMPWYIDRKAKKSPGLCLGHELVAEIVETGSGIKQFVPGDRVFAHHHAPCLDCAACRRRLWAHCETWKKNALSPGGYADYFIVDANATAHDTLKIPPDLPNEEALFIEPLACCVRALEYRGALEPNQTVWVVGLGAMGLLNVLLARALGAGRILATDFSERRRVFAESLGAEAAPPHNAIEWIGERTAGRGVDVVCFCPPSSKALEGIWDGVAPGGRVVLFAPPEEGSKTPVDFNALYFREVTVTSAYSCGPDETRRALEHLACGKVSARSLLTHRVTLEEVPKVLGWIAKPPEDFLKAVVVGMKI